MTVLDKDAETIEDLGDDFINVLDKGYVRLVDVMGDDRSVVNAARASFAKEVKELHPKDVNLLKFLIREEHMSPFRHAFLSFEFKAPLMVARQHWKYVVGSDHTMDSWNESSRRYVTMEPEFYIPEIWRSQPDSKKQGSGGPIGKWEAAYLTDQLMSFCQQGDNLYRSAMSMGACAEQARLFLPAYGMYVVYRWSCSLQSACLFLNQRLHAEAQEEIQHYARAVYRLMQPRFPVTTQALVLEEHV